MAFRASFDCLWCGRRHAAAGSEDLTGWAQLCPACLERAGSNPFLRYRVRRAIADRQAARPGGPPPAGANPIEPGPRRDGADQAASGEEAGRE